VLLKICIPPGILKQAKTDKKKCMKWYLVKIVFQVIIAGRGGPPRFEEQLRIIRAATKDDAMCKAQRLGAAEETTVININNNRLAEWKFINVSTLYQLKELLDGAEIYSSTHEPDCADTYINMIHSKAAYISSNDAMEILQLI
jgi:hypothetical protein